MSFSNTFDTTNQGSAVSNREDLTDVLTILAPEETPVLSSASKQKASATFVEWTVDKLSSPSITGVAEGADVTSFTDKFSGRARLGNYIQKFRRDYMVSDLQEAVDSVGPAKVAQAESKAVRELKRDIEARILSNEDRSVEDGFFVVEVSLAKSCIEFPIRTSSSVNVLLLTKPLYAIFANVTCSGVASA